MGGLFVILWLGGEGMITWRSVKELHMPPSPYALAWSSALFVGLGALATYQPARGFATLFAAGVDLAVLLKVIPGSTVDKGKYAIKANKAAGGWSSIGMAGNTVIIPDGTADSTAVASASDPTASGGGGAGSGTSTAGGAAGGTAAQNQAIAKQVIQANSSSFSGWDTGQQWAALVALWTRESGWSTGATNPSSGAYGIPQSLHGSKGGQGGNEFNASASEGLSTAQLASANAGNAASQILWGLNYILATYGSPAAALAHENSNGWY